MDTTNPNETTFASTRSLRMLFFLDYEDGEGGRFINSPGLLPLVGHVRATGFAVDFITTEAELLQALEMPDVDVVGISSMERLLPRSIPVAMRVRQRRPNVILMLGGNAIDPFAVDLAAGLFDLVVLGESEHILPALLRSIAQARGLHPGRGCPAGMHRIQGDTQPVGRTVAGGALDACTVDSILCASFTRNIPALGTVDIRVGNVFVRDSTRETVWHMQEPASTPLLSPTIQPTEQTAPVRDEITSAPLGRELDDLCIIPWDVLEKEGWKHFEFYTQRGCRWGRCNFCSVADRTIRALSPEKVVDIVAQAVDRGIELVSFADDLFVQHHAWNQELLDRLRARGIRTRYRAQTIANRMVWPFLDLMHEIGFVELAFGVETLNPTRAELMVKSFNGRKYVENAVETIRRTAAAGIYPVLYLIMVDPASTLVQIADELEQTIHFVDHIYSSTGVVPKLSYSLMMLPVACTAMTAHYAYRSTAMPLEVGQIDLPTEFQVAPSVSRYLAQIARQTNQIPHRRENLAALPIYLASVAATADEFNDPHIHAIRTSEQRGCAAYQNFTERLNRDIEALADQFCAEVMQGRMSPTLLQDRFDYRRFGGYIPGIARYHELLMSALSHPALT